MFYLSICQKMDDDKHSSVLGHRGHVTRLLSAAKREKHMSSLSVKQRPLTHHLLHTHTHTHSHTGHTDICIAQALSAKASCPRYNVSWACLGSLL